MTATTADQVARITLPPGRTVGDIFDDPTGIGTHIEIEGPDIPDANHPDNRICGGWAALLSPCDTAHDIAVELAVQLVAEAVHETIEWVRVDGQRLAEPHPRVKPEGMWDWVVEQIRPVIRGYIPLWPEEPR